MPRPRNSAGIIVAVIGDIMIDRYLTGTVDRISPEAPVPILVHRGDHAGAKILCRAGKGEQGGALPGGERAHFYTCPKVRSRTEA